MSHLLEPLFAVPPVPAYLVICLLVFAEAALFFGFVLPGETAVLIGGVLATRGELNLPLLMVLVVLSAVVGDSVGYEVGRHFGDRALDWRPLRRHRPQLDSARALLRRRGGSAVFLGRWTAFLRAVMPGLAGMSRLPYPRFLTFNALGGAVWGVAFCLAGYLAGNSYAVVERYAGGIGVVVFVLVVVTGALLWRRHRNQVEAEAEADGGEQRGAA